MPNIIMNTSSKEKDKKLPLIVTAAVIRDKDRVLVTRRSGGPLEGFWEFPGGKLEPGESPEECLAREIKEELGLEVAVKEIFTVVYHEYDFGPILLLAYRCALVDGELRPSGEGVLWASREDLCGLDFAPADRPVVKKIDELLTGERG